MLRYGSDPREWTPRYGITQSGGVKTMRFFKRADRPNTRPPSDEEIAAQMRYLPKSVLHQVESTLAMSKASARSIVQRARSVVLA
jgi:hypothetical protein